MCNWWKKGLPVVACPFWSQVSLYLLLAVIISMKLSMCGILFRHSSTFLGCFCPRNFFFNMLPWTSFIWDSHTKLMIISRSVPGLAANWCRGWTIRLLCDVPLLCLWFWMIVGAEVWYSGEQFSITFASVFMFFYITQVLLIIFPLK